MKQHSLNHSSLPPTVVTGASSGIGRDIARLLAASGVPVIAIGRNRQRLADLAAESPNVDPLQADLSALDTIDALAEQLLSRQPRLGCLINNAGIQFNQRLDDSQSSMAQVREEIAINLTAPLMLTRALLPHFQRQPLARIVNVSSGLAFAPKSSAAVYCASKAGLHGFSDALRLQLGNGSVRVIEAVMPLVDTPMTAGRGRGKLSARQAAQALIDGLRADRPVIWIGKARAIPVLQRTLPGVLRRVMARS